MGGGASIANIDAFLKNALPLLRLPNPPTRSATSMSAPCPPTLRYSVTRCQSVVPWMSADMIPSSMTDIDAPDSLTSTFSVRTSTLS